MSYPKVFMGPLAILTGLAIIVSIHLGLGAAEAEIPLNPTPAWQSNANGHVATGGAWADVDGDGWLDLVAANGNDIARQHVVIYHNNGDGTFPSSPTWSSGDVDYHGHLDVGDINGDGLVDVAVAVYIGVGGFGDPGYVKVYYNNGSGGFSSTPDWIPDARFYSFSVALGDADGDGDLDLACACGEDYYSDPNRQRVFYNHNGTLETTPSWQSDEVAYSLDVTWDDVEQDGDMDLIYCGTSAPMRIYLNGQTAGGGIATSASWESTDLPQKGNTTAAGDWNGDSYPEIAVADNSQTGGQGRFKVYANTAGSLATTPAWVSNTGGYGSHVSWIDLDYDLDPELVTGRWWSPVMIYENTGGTLTGSPVWTSNTNSVLENLFWGDVDNDNLRADGHTSALGDGARTFFKLGIAPIRAVMAVTVNAVPLAQGEYTDHHGNGWVSLATPPPAGAAVEISYSYSLDIDLGATNWDPSIGNYLFINEAVPPQSVDELPAERLALSVYPNPLRNRAWFKYQGSEVAQLRLQVVDLNGRFVRSLHDGPVPAGLRIWEWDRRDDNGRQVESGVYFARWQTADTRETVRLTVLR
jgi:FG-GAP-like repeat